MNEVPRMGEWERQKETEKREKEEEEEEEENNIFSVCYSCLIEDPLQEKPSTFKLNWRDTPFTSLTSMNIYT